MPGGIISNDIQRLTIRAVALNQEMERYAEPKKG